MSDAADHLALLVEVVDRPGTLHRLTGVISEHGANIAYLDITGHGDGVATTYVELEGVADADRLVADLGKLADVREVTTQPPLDRVYGKRIIVIGGGAQVGQVAMGAISEADRHNIRGERISVDTIPLVGEQALAAAARAVTRLPRVKALVLAGSLMGGEVTKAVHEVRAKGIMVISLNMAGSVPDAADLVVTDPIQAGVMTVMAVADTAKFDIARQRGRRY
jgi:energy-converting hydrogenase B subunit Q